MRTTGGSRTVLDTAIIAGTVAVGTGASGTNSKDTNAIVTVGMGATAAYPTADTPSGTCRPLTPSLGTISSLESTGTSTESPSALGWRTAAAT